MPDSDKLAIAAHLHVLLRRKTGRVTDTEWMAANAEYALEIVRFARQRAQEDNAPELTEWADRLDQAIHAAPPAAPRRPLLDVATQAVRQRMAPPPPEPAPEVPRYVGGIR
ncbi:hypothetical protein KW843_18855 [Acidovorax sp. sif1233]|jgi:hypothetical protein|uniref:hypothetical protein n=1 Tax=unclassified Acidovorax TaxID=2684926 RepID=UPI001C47482E|nr:MULTISPECIES: hypothetical protein [unclassified Acidovorax]MBV7429451.1 hypothetical protein [Acidovorax sp. sif0732]MBV7448529.1 hypothetical protein [Acidovorax sp. sif0715]MBV7456549.1 hypothetical protein [Acidovorax sp. sif1233]